MSLGTIVQIQRVDRPTHCTRFIQCIYVSPHPRCTANNECPSIGQTMALRAYCFRRRHERLLLSVSSASFRRQFIFNHRSNLYSLYRTDRKRRQWRHVALTTHRYVISLCTAVAVVHKVWEVYSLLVLTATHYELFTLPCAPSGPGIRCRVPAT